MLRRPLRVLEVLFVFGQSPLFFQIIQSRDNKTTSTCCQNTHCLAQFGFRVFYGKVRQGAWGVKFTGIASRLKVFQQLFIHIIKAWLSLLSVRSTASASLYSSGLLKIPFMIRGRAQKVTDLFVPLFHISKRISIIFNSSFFNISFPFFFNCSGNPITLLVKFVIRKI